MQDCLVLAVDSDIIPQGVKNFDKTDVARFPLSLVRKETQGEATVRKSALINCETWATRLAK